MADLKRRNAQIERELQKVAASDYGQNVASPVKTFAPTLRDPQPRTMQESRLANALPETPAPRANGLRSEGPYGSGYGGVHASRSECEPSHRAFRNADAKLLQHPSTSSAHLFNSLLLPPVPTRRVAATTSDASFVLPSAHICRSFAVSTPQDRSSLLLRTFLSDAVYLCQRMDVLLALPSLARASAGLRADFVPSYNRCAGTRRCRVREGEK